MSDIKKICKKMRSGEHLTTPELEHFVEHMSKLEELLLLTGSPEFDIVRTHIALQKVAAESFLFHRSLR